jgi:hypothetical protein
MQRRITGIVAAAALQAVALVLAHELVFLARYGSRFGEALAHAGHGQAWSTAVFSSLTLGVVLVTLSVMRLAWLGSLVRRHRPTGDAQPFDWRALARTWLRWAPPVALVTIVILTVQENLERAAIGLAMPGPSILLTAEYAGGLWIALGVGIVVAFVAALFDWRRRQLLARLRAARHPFPRIERALPVRPARIDRPATSIIGRRSALRAPPLGASI